MDDQLFKQMVSDAELFGVAAVFESQLKKFAHLMSEYERKKFEWTLNSLRNSERERCIKICEEVADKVRKENLNTIDELYVSGETGARRCVEAIRKLGEE